MSKKIIFGLAVVLFLTTSNAFAGESQGHGNVDIWMTDDSTGNNEVKKFEWNEMPYLYMYIPNAKDGASINGTWWHSPNSEQKTEYGFTANLDSNSKLWFTFSDWHTNKKQVGQWHVHINGISGLNGQYQTNFTITPEPLSSILFLAGGIALAARLRHRKNPLKI